MAVSGSQEPVRLAVVNNAVLPAISRQGNRLAFEQAIPADFNRWRINLADPAQPASAIIASTRLDQSPQYSPDGRKIAFSSERSGPSAVWVCDADGGNAAQLTTTGTSGSPVWSPDGQRIAFDGIVDGQWQVFTVSARGGKPQQLTFVRGAHTRPFWSRDGPWIFTSGGASIWKIPAGGGHIVPLVHTDGANSNPVESADGKTVYYLARGTIRKVGTDGSGDGEAIDGPASPVSLTPTRDGIYYVAPLPNRSIQFFSFATGHSRLIRKLDRPAGLGLSLSPDRQWLLYVQRDTEATGDLMLVDPFR